MKPYLERFANFDQKGFELGVEKIMAGTPMARFGEPHELVGATILLLSRAAGSFITGATYYVDGGFTAMRL